MDDWLGFDPPAQAQVPATAPAPIRAAQPDQQEVISAGDRLRKKKVTRTNLGGNAGGEPTISASVLYGR